MDRYLRRADLVRGSPEESGAQPLNAPRSPERYLRLGTSRRGRTARNGLWRRFTSNLAFLHGLCVLCAVRFASSVSWYCGSWVGGLRTVFSTRAPLGRRTRAARSTRRKTESAPRMRERGVVNTRQSRRKQVNAKSGSKNRRGTVTVIDVEIWSAKYRANEKRTSPLPFHHLLQPRPPRQTQSRSSVSSPTRSRRSARE